MLIIVLNTKRITTFGWNSVICPPHKNHKWQKLKKKIWIFLIFLYHFHSKMPIFGDFLFLKFQYLGPKVADCPKIVARYVKCPKYLPKKFWWHWDKNWRKKSTIWNPFLKYALTGRDFYVSWVPFKEITSSYFLK
jgi:hypothetical protein